MQANNIPTGPGPYIQAGGKTFSIYKPDPVTGVRTPTTSGSITIKPDAAGQAYIKYN